MLKKIISYVLVVVMVICMNTTTFASDSTTENDEVQVDGKFIKDNLYASMIKEKEEIAMQYYLAKVNKDSEASAKLLNKLKGYSTSSPQLKSGVISPYATSARLFISQVPQEKSYWCGYAAIKSLLDYKGIEKTQGEIVEAVYKKDKDCPWYLTNGNETSQFPVAVYLYNMTGAYYIPCPYGAAGTTKITTDMIEPKIVSTIDSGHGVMILGSSRGDLPNDESKLPGYPSIRVDHWVASDGYEGLGTITWIVDPAKSKVISWSKDIEPCYKITTTKLVAFIKPRGIIW